MHEIKKITKAQWMMILITILSTIIINIIVSAVMIFMIDNHISDMTLVECQDKIYDHITGRATGEASLEELGNIDD